MAFVEGRGNVAPAPISVCLDAADMEMIERQGQRRALERNYSGRSDRWGKGIIQNAPLVGMIGEWGTKRWIDKNMGHEVCMIDDSYKVKGDGGKDITACGLILQVKATPKPSDKAKCLLIKRHDQRFGIIPLVADIFVFVANASANKPEIMGWIAKKDVLKSSFARSHVQGMNHWNIEIPTENLEQMGRLISKLKTREMRGAETCR